MTNATRRRFLALSTAALAAGALVLPGCSAGSKTDAGAAAPAEASPGELTGKSFAGIAAKDLGGNAVDVGKLVAGKVAIVDFWATWCAPCVKAMPHLQALYDKNKDKGFTVVGVMVDRNASRIGPDFVKEKGVSYPIVIDDDGTESEKSVGTLSGIPMLLLIDQQGKIVQVFQGFASADVLEKAVADALKGAPAGAPKA